MAKRTKQAKHQKAVAPDTVGGRLRKARERMGLSASEVCQQTKMHPRVIRAIEDNQADKALSPVYMRSFLRMYAELVGMDPAVVIREFAKQLPPSSESSLRRSVPAPKVPPAGAVQSATAARTLSTTTKSSATTAVGVTPPPRHRSQVPWTLPRIDMGAMPAWTRWRPTATHLRWAGYAVAGLALFLGCATLIQRGCQRVANRQLRRPVATTVVRPSSARQSVTVPLDDPLQLQINAEEDSWMRVMADDRVVFMNVLKRGQTEQWDAAKRLVLWITNAGGVRMVLNGREYGAPGKRREVIRELVITHQGIERVR